jgi:hypothetical protein
MKPSSIDIDLGSVSMSCTAEEIAGTLAALLGEMRAVLPKLREDERDVLRQIMSQDSGTLTVVDVFPDFSRESEGHKTLRRLRAAQFIRPARTGRWDPDEPIEIKPFARLMWDHIGEDAIFDGVAPVPATPVPMATPADDVVDLGLVDDVNLAGSAAHAEPVAEPAVEPAAEPVDEQVVDLGEIEEEPVEKAVSEEKPAAGFSDDNLDLGDYDDLCAYAEEELRGKR